MLPQALFLLLGSSSAAPAAAAAAFATPSTSAASFHGCASHGLHATAARGPSSLVVLRAGGGTDETKSGDDNNAMSFLRKVGRVGGAANMDFSNALGLDESPSGGTRTSFTHEGGFKNVRKSRAAYTSCTESGVVDDLSDPFPFTSSGNEWQGVTDMFTGGLSTGSLTREDVAGRTANVLRGKVVSPQKNNKDGFIKMAVDLTLDPAGDVYVDASEYDGIELEVYCEGLDDVESFNLHLRNPACKRQLSSYRTTFKIKSGTWVTLRLPWDVFDGYGPGPDVTPFVPSLRRMGIFSIGEAKDVFLAISKVAFYN